MTSSSPGGKVRSPVGRLTGRCATFSQSNLPRGEGYFRLPAHFLEEGTQHARLSLLRPEGLNVPLLYVEPNASIP